MFKIEIAGLVIGIDNHYEYVSRLCEPYKANGRREDFQVSVTRQEILKEQVQSTEKFPLAYCESICLYRRICLKLIDYDAFLMHSAALKMNGKAFVFAAKSGVGKTTHVRLWMEEFAGRVQVINGDKPVIRFMDNAFYVCGTPWCGKEGLGNSVSVPMQAICFLEQSRENHIRRLEISEVIGRIFHQMLMPREEEAMSHFLELVDKMLASVDCYILQCNKEREAALAAYEGMRGSEGADKVMEENRKNSETDG